MLTTLHVSSTGVNADPQSTTNICRAGRPISKRRDKHRTRFLLPSTSHVQAPFPGNWKEKIERKNCFAPLRSHQNYSTHTIREYRITSSLNFFLLINGTWLDSKLKEKTSRATKLWGGTASRATKFTSTSLVESVTPVDAVLSSWELSRGPAVKKNRKISRKKTPKNYFLQ